MDPKDIFESTTLSIWRVMQESNRGLYIPAYQRPYSWSQAAAKALLAGICEGITWLEADEAAITVLGTFIFVLDTEKATIEPVVKDELPSSVFLVIDGQQRLSTLALLVALLDDRLRQSSAKLPKGDVLQRWTERTLATMQTNLQAMLTFDRGFGADQAFRFYPRMIRAFDDSWSTDSQNACYESPIATFLHSYIRHIKSSPQPSERFQWTAGDDQQSQVLLSVWRTLSRQLDGLVAGGHDEAEPPLPTLVAIAKSEDKQKRFFEAAVPAEVLASWDADVTGKSADAFRKLCRTMIIARYLLERVAVTQVVVKREAYAFDLFETLNTTGDPLTAYETFKPLVIKAEGLSKYRLSDSFEHMAVVDRFFDSNATRRREASDGLLIPFALFESGKKLGKQLRDQRNWLRHTYEEGGAPGRGRHFVQGMAVVARFMTECWQENSTNFGEYVPPECISDFQFCLEVLRAAKHEVTIALLSRLFEGVYNGRTKAERLAAGAELAGTLRAVTAFFALWRGSRVGTGNIDTVYRNLLQGSPDGALGFKRSGGRTPTASSVREALRAALTADDKGRIRDRDDWVTKASALDVYKQSTDLTRLLLLAAGHDAVPDPSPGATGLLVPSKTGVCPTLTLEAWKAGQEVEHVAPRREPSTAKDAWPESVYVDEKLDTLGNLWLLPSRENKSAGNRGWAFKRIFYRALAAKTAAEANAIIAQAKMGHDLGELTEVILANAQYMPYIQALAALPEDHVWDAKFVDLRSRNLAEMAWDTLAPWLDLK